MATNIITQQEYQEFDSFCTKNRMTHYFCMFAMHRLKHQDQNVLNYCEKRKWLCTKCPIFKISMTFESFDSSSK